MIARALILSAGVAGALGTAQWPEFAQQYLQRLGGTVDALALVIADFDTSAAASGLSRTEALAEMQGTEFLARRRADIERTIARHDRLAADLTALERARPDLRALHLARYRDPGLLRATAQAYRPALPVTWQGAGFGLAGFALGGGLARGAGRLMRRA